MAGALTKAGRYQIVAELGRGSMGVVYQGYDPVIGRTVAIKTMLTEGLGAQEFQEYKARFQREAQAAGALTHPNIVTVYDFGEDSGVLYLAMEFLEGKSLDKIVEAQNILPIETIIPMYEQVCGALDHAHSHKIVHRDIKPANIMILESGLVKVTDFGIAKMMSLGMTQAGQILGTPNYMSPEQVKGRQVDGRSDIFSLGVILYELVTGEKPFGGQNITTVIYKIINENPTPPRELDATIPLGLNYVVSKALAKNPDERYQTCRELAEDLKNYKTLGGTAPSATVVLKVPPIQPAAPEALPPVAPTPIRPQAPAPAPQPEVRQVSVQMIPPVTTKAPPQGSSAATWVLLTLLIAGVIGGGGYYFFVWKPEQAKQAKLAEANRNIVPTSPPPVNPAPGGTPAGGATTAGGQQPPAPGPTETTPTPPPKVEPTKPPQEAAGSVPLPGAARPSRPEPAPKMGTLIIKSNPSGAKITVDGQSSPDWVTPKTFAQFAAGTHQVLLSKEGYGDVMNSVTVEGGKTASLSPKLTVPTGEIKIVTTPPGFEVQIDGEPAGTSPVQESLPIGQHTYVLRRGGTELYRKTFKIETGTMLTSKVDLSGGGAVSTGVVTVRTIPSGASVLADGSPVGNPTPTSFSLSIGHHVLVLSLAGSRPLQVEIDVKPEGVIVEKTLH